MMKKVFSVFFFSSIFACFTCATGMVHSVNKKTISAKSSANANAESKAKLTKIYPVKLWDGKSSSANHKNDTNKKDKSEKQNQKDKHDEKDTTKRKNKQQSQQEHKPKSWESYVAKSEKLSKASKSEKKTLDQALVQNKVPSQARTKSRTSILVHSQPLQSLQHQPKDWSGYKPKHILAIPVSIETAMLAQSESKSESKTSKKLDENPNALHNAQGNIEPVVVIREPDSGADRDNDANNDMDTNINTDAEDTAVNGSVSSADTSVDSPSSLASSLLPFSSAFAFASVSPFLRIGAYIGSQTNQCPDNRDFAGVKPKLRTTTGGFSLAVGMDWHVAGNFSVGAEVGASYGSNGRNPVVGNTYHDKSAQYQEVYGQLMNVIGGIKGQLGIAVYTVRLYLGGAGNTIDLSRYKKFVDVLHYLGGADNIILDQTFISDRSINFGLVDTLANLNTTATLYDFTNVVLDHSHLDLFRNFISSYYPKFASTLRMFKDNVVRFNDSNATVLSNFFNAGDLVSLGPDFTDISTADPDEANQAVREFLDGKHIELPDSTENPKASFGVSPTASLVLKYFIPTFATSGIYLVFKVGAEQSRGVARIQSIEKDENFRQMSTLISFGFERPFGEFFWSLMITRRMSRTIKLSPMIDILGNSINPRLKLSDTRLEMSLIKRL